MGSLSNYGENALLNHITANSPYTPVATLYLALCTADPGETATGAAMNEVANAGSYARTAITFGAASTRRVTQNAAVNFPTATAGWGTITHWVIVDSATYGAGNVLAYGALNASKTVVTNNAPTIASGAVYVDLTASTGLSNYAANGFLDRMFRNQAFTVSGTWVGLATATLTDATTAPTEVSGGSYARVRINIAGGASPAWGAVSGGSVTNANQVDFTTPTASWGTVVAMFMADALTVGNVLWYDNGITDQAVASGDPVYFPASNLTLTQG